MNLPRNKKSMILILLLSVFVVFFLMPTIFIKVDSSKGVFSIKIGETQFKILDAVQESQENLFLIDQAAKYSAYLALNKIEEFGGYYDVFPCGQIDGYSIWQDEKNSCFSDTGDLVMSLQKAITPYLNSYLKNLDMNEDNYDYFIKPETHGLRLVGTALRDIVTNITLNKKIIGKYSIKPSFDISLDYDLGFYDELTELFIGYNGILSNIARCESTKKLKECANEVIGEYNQDSNILIEIDCEGKDNKEDRMFLFCATKKESKYIIFDSSIREAEQKIKFAAYIRKSVQEGLNDFQVVNPAGTDDELLLKWGEKEGIDNYQIHYGDNNLILDLSKAELIEYSPEGAVFKKIGEKPSPFIGAGKLYLNNQNFYYLISDLDNKEYEFTLSAVDSEGNKIDKKVKIKPIDRLAPGKIDFSVNPDSNKLSLLITAPNEDMDGSLIGSDKNKIYIFAKKGDCKDILSIENYNAQADFSGNPIDIYTVGGESVGSGNTYCAAVIATDTSNNPIEIKLKEGSLTDKELVVKPEYNEILYELSNSQSITIP